ncbi:N-acetylneuraminate synthase family protein [Chryseobacterium echinoideorum]|uniref:N-acetylneuraminate synthase family protein n=1 Tax=Chryseobacterium echinoideorum TaxID=1549648 RepID=UPI0011858107|nr:N-acetylneuraminate synthase family protein [Chryseobacterium echinoideorum]
MNNHTYLYTETAFHHEGDYNYLMQLIDESKRIGVNGIKFQVLTNCGDFVSPKHKDYDILSKFCFSYDQWNNILSYTQSIGLDIILMPLNTEAIKLSHFAKYIDIHSVSFNDRNLLEKINSTECKIILGIGGRTEDEVDDLISFFGKKVEVLMVGFQSFPSALEDVNLAKINYYHQKYPSLRIGYADHSSYNDKFSIISNDYARFLGATVFEKHITMKEGEERTDYSSAVSGDKIKEIMNNLNFIDTYILHKNHLEMSVAENNYRNRQLIAVATKSLAAGTILKEDDISLKLYHQSENQHNIKDELIGKKLLENIEKDYPISKAMIT